MYDKKLVFRLDEDLENKLKLRSKKYGISYAECIRELIKKEYIFNNLDTIYTFINKLDNCCIELNKIGVNINQIARGINGQKYLHNRVSLLEDEIVEVSERLSKILEDLGGVKNANCYENSRGKKNE